MDVTKEEKGSLTSFLLTHKCCPAPARPNTTPQFRTVDTTYPPLNNFSSPFKTEAWATLLHLYPGPLPFHLLQILRFGTQIGYIGLKVHILSPNLQSALLDPGIIHQKLTEDLFNRCVVQTAPNTPFISSSLGLVPKHNGGYRRIHHLSHPSGASVNDFIDKKSVHLRYTSFQEVLNQVQNAGRHAIIMKKDIKDAF